MARELTPLFFDSSVLIGALVRRGEDYSPPRRVLLAVREGRLSGVHTAWHCCLEFYAVLTRLPFEFRLPAGDVARVLDEVVFALFQVHDMDRSRRIPFIAELVTEHLHGSRIYDAHIADVARQCGCVTVVTENPRHFTSLIRHGIRVLTASQLAAEANL